MSIGAGIRTRADIDINLNLAKSAAWNKMQDELGDLKRFLNDIAKTVGIQKPISEYEKLSEALAKTKLELKTLKDAQKAQIAQAEQSSAAMQQASKATIVHTKSITSLKNGLKSLQNMDDRATAGLVEGWKAAGNGAYAFQARLGKTAQIVGEVVQNFSEARKTINYFTDATDNSERTSRAMTRSLVQMDEEMVQLNRTMKAEDELFDMLERQYVDATRRATANAVAQEKLEDSIHRVTVRMKEQRDIAKQKADWNADFRRLNDEVKIREHNERTLRKEAKARSSIASYIIRENKVLDRLIAAKKQDIAATTTLAGRINKYERQLDAVFRASFRLQMAGNDLLQFSRRVTTYITDSLDAWGEFEYMMNRAAGALSATDEVMGDLQTGLLDLTVDMRLFPAKEVAEAMYYWGSTTGQVVKTTDDLAITMRALSPIMKAAAMTNTGYEETVKGVYSVIAQYYNGAVGMATNVTEKLFYVTQRTAAEFPDLINSFKMVGPIAKANNVTFESMVNLFGRLADLGVRGSMAGRAFRQLFIQMLRPSGPAIKAITEVFTLASKTVDEFNGKSYYELMFPKGQFVGVEGYLRNLALATEKMTQAERNSFLAKIATANELPVLTALVNDNIRALNGNTAAMEKNVTSSKEASKFFEDNWRRLSTSWKGTIGSLNATFEALKIQFGSVLAEVLTPFVNTAKEIIQQLREWATKNKALVEFASKVVIIGTAVAAATGAILVFVGAVAGVASALYIAIRSFAPLAGTIAASIAGVIALADAFIRNFEYIQKTVQDAIFDVQDALNQGEDSFGGISDAISAFTDSFRGMMDVVVKGGAFMVRIFASLLAGLIEFNKVVPIFTALASVMAVMFAGKVLNGMLAMVKISGVLTLRMLGLGAAMGGIGKALSLANVAGSIAGLNAVQKGLLGVVTIAKSIGPGGLLTLVMGAGFLAYETDFLGFAGIIDTITDRFRDLKNEIKEVSSGFGTASNDIAQNAKLFADEMVKASNIKIFSKDEMARGIGGGASLSADIGGNTFFFNDISEIAAEEARASEKKMLEIMSGWKANVDAINADIAQYTTGISYSTQDAAVIIDKLIPILGTLSQKASLEKAVSGIMKGQALGKSLEQVYNELAPQIAEIADLKYEEFVKLLGDNMKASQIAADKKQEMFNALYRPAVESIERMIASGITDEALTNALIRPVKVAINGEWIDGQSISAASGLLSGDVLDSVSNFFSILGKDIGDELESLDSFSSMFEATWKPVADNISMGVKEGLSSVMSDSMLVIGDDLNDIVKQLPYSGIQGGAAKISKSLGNIIANIMEKDLMIPDYIKSSLLEVGDLLLTKGVMTKGDYDAMAKLFGQAGEEEGEKLAEVTWSEYVDRFTNAVDSARGLKKALEEAGKRGSNAKQLGDMIAASNSAWFKKALRSGNLQQRQIALQFQQDMNEGIVGAIVATRGKAQGRLVRRLTGGKKMSVDVAQILVDNISFTGREKLHAKILKKLGRFGGWGHETTGPQIAAAMFGSGGADFGQNKKGKKFAIDLGASEIKIDIGTPEVIATPMTGESASTLIDTTIAAPMKKAVSAIDLSTEATKAISTASSQTVIDSATKGGNIVGGAFSTGIANVLYASAAGSIPNSAVGARDRILSALRGGRWNYGGQMSGIAWASGFNTGIRNNVLKTFSYVADVSIGNSPPKAGPLKNIDKGGFNIGAAWGKGTSRGAEREIENGMRRISNRFSGGKYGNSLGLETTINRKRELDVNIKISGGSDVNRDTASQIRKGVYDAIVDNDLLSHIVTVS